jgi:hypothetical protein
MYFNNKNLFRKVNNIFINLIYNYFNNHLHFKNNIDNYLLTQDGNKDEIKKIFI